MSGVYIKGMEMPTSENVVILINPSGGVWMIGDMPNEDTYLVKAKAIPVPDNGRLIDADALCKTLRNLAENEYTPTVFANWIEHHIDTIIPADKEVGE